MTPERWHQIEELFNRALDVPAEQRSAFLTEVCGADAELREMLERLVRSDAEAADFIETPPHVSQITRLVERTVTLNDESVAHLLSQGQAPSGLAANQMIGRQIGAYKIERELGRGGMGEVYLAWRADNEFRKQVAIKLVRRGVGSEFVLRRFRRERQILASFDHPNIARLLDGGTTEDGLPYFVMEYIEGLALTRFCDEQQLSLDERLKLFSQVCAAVEYAHQQQVIHRDIKPGNILVTAQGTAKLLDFGIARILNPSLLLDTGEHTVTGMQMMTPEYASPEQMRGEAVTSASDQYSLGVLLYELLTGRRPYQLRHKLLHEVARLIIEEPPTRPSTIVKQTEEVYSPTFGQTVTLTPELVSRQRGTSPETLSATLASGLDAIVLKTLSKDPAHRYATVAELATDIQHWLQGLPVAAPAVVSLRENSANLNITTGKRRHSLAILPLKPLHLEQGSAEATQNFLGVGLADALITRLSNLRNLTVRPTASVLKYASPGSDAVQAGQELNVTHVLDGHFLQAGERIRVTVQLIEIASAAPKWAARFDEGNADLLALQDLLVEQVAAEIARNLSSEERAQVVKRGTDNPEAYEAYLRGRYYWHTYTEDGLARAITCFYDAIALDPQFAAAYTGVADYFNWMGITGLLPPEECFQAAKQAATNAIELDDKLAEAYVSLALATWAYEWDHETSRYLMQQAIALNGNYAQAHEWLAHFYSSQGQHTEAINSMRRALRIDPRSPALHAMMSFILHNARQHSEAYRYNQRALELQPDYYLALQAKSWLYPRVGTAEEALRDSRKAVELTERAPLALWSLAHVLATTGQRAEAHAVLDELRQLAGKRYIPHYFFARIHTALGEYDAAFEALQRACERRESWALEMQVDPQLDALRSDPRFGRLLAQLHPFKASTDGGTMMAELLAEQETVAEDAPSLSTPAALSASEGPAALAADTSVPAGRALGYAGTEACVPKEGAQVPPAAKPSLKKWWLAAAVLLISLSTALFFFKARPTPAVAVSDYTPNSLAVLPFRNALGDEAVQSLGTGLADAVTMRLSQIKQLAVRPAFSLQQSAQSDPVQIAREQRVEFVVSGDLQRQGDRVRLRAQMFSARANRVLWQVEFDEPATDLAWLQALLTERVLRELKFEVSGNELLQLTKSYTANHEAYQAYLVGRYHFSRRSVPALYEAIEYFEQAAQRDQNFALAYVGLADCYALLNQYGTPPPRDAYERARENAKRALALDNQLAEPHTSLAYVLFWHDRDRAEAERELRRAIELNPSYPTAHHWLALMLSAMGRLDEAKEQLRQAEQLDPRSAIIKTAAAMVWFYARQYDEALAWSRRALELDPGLVPAHKVQRWIYQTQGNYAGALAAYHQEKSFSGVADEEWPVILAQVQASGDRTAEAQAALQRGLASAIVQQSPEFLTYEIALAYTALGQLDEAFAKAEAARMHSFNFVTVDPRLERLRTDARYETLVRKAGFDN
jgi:eukaryotic-like serine/threonine-protein kinase